MAALNINRLTTHIDELRLFTTQEKIDILAINETKLDDLVGKNDIYVPGYEIVRRDRATNGHNGDGIENIEFYLLGDANSNLLPGSHDFISRSLLNVLDIYGLRQLITKPTCVTATSDSLIDVCITNSPESSIVCTELAGFLRRKCGACINYLWDDVIAHE